MSFYREYIQQPIKSHYALDLKRAYLNNDSNLNVSNFGGYWRKKYLAYHLNNSLHSVFIRSLQQSFCVTWYFSFYLWVNTRQVKELILQSFWLTVLSYFWEGHHSMVNELNILCMSKGDNGILLRNKKNINTWNKLYLKVIMQSERSQTKQQ